MSNVNSNGNLTQSHESEGCNINIDDLTVREARKLGYLLLDHDEKLIYEAGRELIKIGIKNTNFECEDSISPVKESAS